MKVWVLQGSYQGEMFATVHLTQKGCVLACLTDLFDFLAIGDEETALDAMNDYYAYTETDGKQTKPFEWDLEKMKGMSSQELWEIFRNWTDHCWERMADQSYNIEAQTMEVQA